jgi:hypothetical protein
MSENHTWAEVASDDDLEGVVGTTAQGNWEDFFTDSTQEPGLWAWPWIKGDDNIDFDLGEPQLPLESVTVWISMIEDGRRDWHGDILISDDGEDWTVVASSDFLESVEDPESNAHYNRITYDFSDVDTGSFQYLRVDQVKYDENSELPGELNYWMYDGSRMGHIDMTLVAPALEGDYNDDAFVGQGDLDLVLLNWGDTGDTGGAPEGWVNDAPAAGDLIGQGYLDKVLLNWGEGTAPTSTVPEPLTMTLLGLGGACVLARRRRRS